MHNHIMVGAEQEETDTVELAFNNHGEMLSVQVSTQEEHIVKELLLHGELNAKQQEVNTQILSDQKHGDEKYLEELITTVVEYQKRTRSVPISSEKYQKGKHDCPIGCSLVDPWLKS